MLGLAILIQLVCAVTVADQHADRAAIQAQERELARKWGRPVSILTPTLLISRLTCYVADNNWYFSGTVCWPGHFCSFAVYTMLEQPAA
jgi:hypothetical protein